MNKITLKIEGMSCGMCEAHMNETVRKIVPEATKISSSHKKGETVFYLDGVLDQKKLTEAIQATGYSCKEIEYQAVEVKKGLFGLW